MKRTVHTRNFKAELNTHTCSAYDNAELTLTLVLGLRKINPVGDEGIARMLRRGRRR